ncbi:MAG: Hsp20/alpha crystallin family protein [Alphaproteobacteria bacterium]|nr:Hsp20/alpha crystallin family protein [Alphaproteobacteria bacterium]
MLSNLSAFPAFAAFDALDALTRAAPRPGFPVNVYASDDALVFRALLPGVTQEQLTLDIEDGVLRISATRDLDAPEGFRAVYRERTGAELTRAFRLGVRVDPESATATLEDGVLTVRLPLATTERTRRIPITNR